MSMIPAATTLVPANPHSGLIPMRKEPEPPVTLMSASACPAYDWPRITVNVPTIPDTTATTPPASSATRTGALARKPGSTTALRTLMPCWRSGGRLALERDVEPVAAPGHDQDPAVHVDHVDVMPVQFAEHVAPDDLVGGPAGGPPVGHVDDPVHDRQQRVHLVSRDQHRDPLLPGDAGEQRDDLLLAGDVEVGQRLVEQQQAGAADQRVRDQDPLLLPAGQQPDPRVRDVLGVDGRQHLVHQLAPRPRRQRDAEPVPVQAKPDQVPGPQRHVGIELDLLRHVADPRHPRPARPAVDPHLAGVGRQQAEYHPQQGGLARPVGADQADELTGLDPQSHVLEHLAAAESHADVVDGEHVFGGGGCSLVGHRHNFCVEILSVTARCRAATSASIHDW